MPRFFMEAELNVDHTVELTETVFHHWVKVLRAQVGETATLFNGQGGEYEVTLSDVAKKSASVQVTAFTPTNRTPAFKTLLGQVMSKGDRMDYVIQKAVELGVSEIQLLTSERCEMRLKYDRDQKKIDHWPDREIGEKWNSYNRDASNEAVEESWESVSWSNFES